MKLFRGIVHCPRCSDFSEQGIAVNGRVSMLNGIYLTRSKKYALDYGVLHIVDVPLEQLGKIKRYQYFFNLEMDYQTSKDELTSDLLALGYDAVVIKGGHEVIVISERAKQVIADNIQRYEWN